MKRIGILVSLIALMLCCQITRAQVVSTNSSGIEKNIFYSNESVYFLTLQNITVNTTTVNVYVVNDSNSWSDGTNLTSLRVTNKTVQTNGSGYINNTLLWQNLVIGKYDIVIDTGYDNFYNSSYDYIDNATITGFEVVALPVPTLAALAGAKSPANHTWDISINGTNDNAMLQIRLDTGSYENITLQSVSLSANGAGNDKDGISSVKLTLDSNNDGVYTSDETILGMGKYLADDGIVTLSVANSTVIPANSTAYLLVIYTMAASANNTFSCSATSVSAVGIGSGILLGATGVPVLCSIANVSNMTTTSTSTTSTSTSVNGSTTSSSTSTAASTSSSSTTTTTVPSDNSAFMNGVYIVIVISIISAAVFGYIFFKNKMTDQNLAFEKLKEKWKWKYKYKPS